MPSKKLIAIAYPHPGKVSACFMDSYVKFREFDLQHGDILGAVLTQKGMYIAGQRNRLVREFLTTPLEWMLCMDSDHEWAPEVPYLLLQSAEEAQARVMSALYFGMLEGFGSPMWWQKTPEGEFYTVNEIKAGIQEIAGFGMGMVLIHRTVFEEMAPLRPDDPWKWFGHDLTMFNGKLERFGEDLCFCNRLSEMGIKMYGDSRIMIGHDKGINLDFETFKKLARFDKEGETPLRRVIDPIV